MSVIIHFIKSLKIPSFIRQVAATAMGLTVFFCGLVVVVSGTMAAAVYLVKEETSLLSDPREWHPGEEGILHVSLQEPFAWNPPCGFTFTPSRDKQSKTSSLSLLQEVLDKAATDPCIKAVVIEAEKAKAAFPTLDEVRSMIARFRKASLKPVGVVSSATQLDARDFFLFADVDFLYIAPGKDVCLRGMFLSSQYMREQLDWQGMKYFVARSGAHKTAYEEYERTESSEQSRYKARKYVEYIWEHLLEAIASGHRLSQKGLTRESLDEIPSAYPLLSYTEAAERGLVCLGGFHDAFFQLLRMLDEEEGGLDSEPEAGCQPASTLLADPADLKATALAELQDEQALDDRVAPAGSRMKLVPLSQYALHTLYADEEPNEDDKDQIGVAVLEGELTDDVSELPTSPWQVAKQIRKYRADPHIKAVVLIVNCPGGTIAPAMEIARSIEKVKKVKPVVVHGVDSATSAGYRVAAPASWIVMSPYTCTGSIGCCWLGISQKEAMRMDGIREEVLHKTHPYSDMDIDDEDVQEMYKRSVQEDEKDFCEAVAKARGLTPEHVASLAGGQLWMAEEAVANQLIDQVGTFQDAVAKAAQLAGLSTGGYKLVFPEQKPDSLPGQLQEKQPPQNALFLPAPELIQLIAGLFQRRSRLINKTPCK